MCATVPDTEPALTGGTHSVHHHHLSVARPALGELEQTGVSVATETVMCPQITARTLKYTLPVKGAKPNPDSDSIPWEHTLRDGVTGLVV